MYIRLYTDITCIHESMNTHMDIIHIHGYVHTCSIMYTYMKMDMDIDIFFGKHQPIMRSFIFHFFPLHGPRI